jgi:hypothetical protein
MLASGFGPGGIRTCDPRNKHANILPSETARRMHMCLRLSLARDLYGSGTAQWIVRRWLTEEQIAGEIQGHIVNIYH